MRDLIPPLLLFFLFSISMGRCGGSETISPISEGAVLVNGLLIDGTGSEPILGGVVAFAGNTIIAVGDSSAFRFEDGVEVIDVQGAAILPGIINAHVHHGYSGSNLRAWARAGVTTVRDLGANPNQDLVQIRDDLRSDESNARLVIAGPLLTEPNGYPTIPFGSASAMHLPTVEDARSAVNNLLDDGIDLIKVAIERGQIFGEQIPTLSDEKLAEIVNVAHGRQTRVSAHITISSDLARALDAGVDDIAHMAVDEAPDSLIDRMVRENVQWVPALELWYGVGYGFVDVAKENLKRFVAAGGVVALGTDFDGYWTPFDPGLPITEITLMHEAGMTPMQIIQAMTKNAARVCDLDNQLGTLEAGKIADILVVNGNPLEDLSSLSDVHMVIHDGRIIRSAD